MNMTLRRAAMLLPFISLCWGTTAQAQVLTWAEKAKKPSKPGQIFILVEPKTPFRLIFPDGGGCVEVFHTLPDGMWLETTHPNFDTWKSKPPEGWRVGACTADKEAGK